MLRPNREISCSAGLRDAMLQMDEQRIKLLFVVDDERRFLAPLSMGDIQRHYLQHNHFDATSGDLIAARESIVATRGKSRAEIKAEMRLKRLEAMPVIGEHGRVVEVVEWCDILESIPRATTIATPVVVMAGGKGTRMRPLTHVIPKPLIPLGDQTILEHILDNYSQAGCSKFWLSINYKGDMIRQYIDELSPHSWEIEYVSEESFTGTAGSLHLLKGRINETFIVCNCDILIQDNHAELLAHHQSQGNELTAVAAVHEQAVPYGVFECEPGGLLTDLIEKPTYTFMVNTGMYILEPHLLQEIPSEGVFHMTDLIDRIRERKGRVGLYPVSDGSWLDIGTWDEYHGACQRLGLRGLSRHA